MCEPLVTTGLIWVDWVVRYGEKHTICVQLSDSGPMLRESRWEPVLQETEIAPR